MDVYSIVKNAKPKDLPSPPDSLDHADHVVKTALLGYTQLAADHLLNPDLVGSITYVIGCIIRQLNLEFLENRIEDSDSEEIKKEKILKRAYAYDVLLEIAINFYGLEKDRVGFDDYEVRESLSMIEEILREWERIERKETSNNAPIAEAVVRLKIDDMKKVLAGNPKRTGMITVMGENIEKRIEKDDIMASFLDAVKEEIQSNIYYVMSARGLCKFGNDYAIGLRWLRRLGYVQVSTNPVLAAIAYKDDPSLWEKFKDYLRKHQELLENPEERKDELAMAATMIALWPNMEVFRPIALLSRFYDGLVSYQLNPNVADSFEGSLRDALEIYTRTQEYFKKYDEYLVWGWSTIVERGRPNIVFKVAGSSPAAIDITRELESMGIGTNNTVTYAVSQEARLILAKMEGMAKALKRGIHTTQAYETNMGGRLEGHLREVLAAKLIKQALETFDDKLAALTDLAKKLGVPVEDPAGPWTAPTGWGYDVTAKTLDEKIELVSFRAYLRPLNKEPFIEFLAKAGVGGSNKEEVKEFLEDWERVIGYAGTLVAQRVWWIFFSPENRNKWLAYLIRKYGLKPEQAEEILDNIDVLPASKRKPLDTYLTLASNNMTNTEFPDHQLNVLKMAGEPNFDLSKYENAIMFEHDHRIIEKLMTLEDFRKAYEITPYLAEIFSEVGVDTRSLGLNGLRPEEWSSFGPAVKTMKGFTNAYLKFRDEAVRVAKELCQS